MLRLPVSAAGVTGHQRGLSGMGWLPPRWSRGPGHRLLPPPRLCGWAGGGNLNKTPLRPGTPALVPAGALGELWASLPEPTPHPNYARVLGALCHLPALPTPAPHLCPADAILLVLLALNPCPATICSLQSGQCAHFE